jgi:hypothetical protein
MCGTNFSIFVRERKNPCGASERARPRRFPNLEMEMSLEVKIKTRGLYGPTLNSKRTNVPQRGLILAAHEFVLAVHGVDTH